MLTYYITDRSQFAGSEAERRAQLLHTIGQGAAAGVDYIQLREKDLTVRELERLAREAVQVIRGAGPARLLINHRTDVALAAGADGVHLTASDIAASDARALAAGCGLAPRAGDLERRFLVVVSCHSAQQVRLAEAHGADFAVLAPVFEKVSAEKATQGIGLDELRRVTQTPASDPRVEAGESRRRFPVFALGGVDVERAPLCAAAGAAGIAGIRVFQQCSDLPALVRSLRLL